MALRPLTDIQECESNIDLIRSRTHSISGVLREIQQLTITRAAGATAATNIAIAGIATEDTLLAVIEFVTAGTGVNNRTGEASITSAGNIQLSTTNTTNNFLLVFWYNKN